MKIDFVLKTAPTTYWHQTFKEAQSLRFKVMAYEAQGYIKVRSQMVVKSLWEKGWGYILVEGLEYTASKCMKAQVQIIFEAFENTLVEGRAFDIKNHV